MATGKIERDDKGRGRGWLIALLAAAIVAGLVLWLFLKDDEVEREARAPVATEPAERERGQEAQGTEARSDERVDVAGRDDQEPITDVALVFVPAEQQRNLTGRLAQLSSLYVTRVVSDHGFYVVPNDRRDASPVFVYLVPGETTEQGQDVNQGQVLSVTGTFTATEGAHLDSPSLTEPEKQAMKERDVYLRAIRVQGAAAK